MNPRVTERIAEIRNDSVHGASWLSRQAISTLNLAVGESQAATVADFADEINMVAAELIEARPGMISIANYITRLIDQITLESKKGRRLSQLKTFAQAKSQGLIELSEEASSKAAESGSGIISNGDIMLTCSYSSTICKAFELAKQKGTEFRVIISESRSRDKFYGEMTAAHLKQHRIPVEVIQDQDIRLHVPEANKALVGADSILADGSLINGTPTYELARAAREEHIPFYTVCETAKFDIRGSIPNPPGLEPGFDKIPPALITGIINENGIITPDEVAHYTASKVNSREG